ncbi:MAG: pyridoxamine kinase [Sphaerochaeta sp.]|jgi:pyridoxine kinase|nr:pyridoxamine kinase [Sphaerochaeta sp.]PKL27857.1 MAG: carbohydrate kinase [Spirochaetae bacterium HGW-Spirochaetae-2]
MKTVVAVHDLSCYAKSSLTVVIPALSALGVEASILPTALLSTQTDGFDNYAFVDLTDTMEAVLRHWRTLGLKFDSIYSGFLGSERQIDTVSELITWQQEAGLHPLVLVDPVLGDQGEPYGPVSFKLIERMAHLVSKADVITPNVTEAALLLGKPFDANLSVDEAIEWAKELSVSGPAFVAITSVMEGTEGVVVAYDGKNRNVTCSRQTYAPISYPGCGDLFASILCAMMVRDIGFSQAVESAARLVSLAVYASWNAHVETRRGVAVELIVPDLVQAIG